MHRLARERRSSSRVCRPGLLVGLCLATAAGCRICPDPFDYSGPVPNGSVTQNDFRARSNGTRQLGAAPHPWPPVVQAEQRSLPVADDGGTSSVLVTAGTMAADGENSVVPALNTAVDQSAEEADSGPAPTAAEPAESAPAGAESAEEPKSGGETSDPSPSATPADADAAATPTPSAAVRGAETLPASVAVPGLPRPVPAEAETPGWKRRGPRRFE
jgi:hypothetical protein